MKCLQLLLLLCCCSIQRLSSCITVNASCSSAYWKAVHCALDTTGDPVGSNTTYSLNFSLLDSDERFSCPLLRTDRGYSCLCVMGQPPDDLFSSEDEYDIELCHGSVCCGVKKAFTPAQNIQLTAPHRPEVQETPEAADITWKSGYEQHRYLKNDIDYRLLLQTSDSAEAKPSELNSPNRSVFILKSQLNPRTTYCVKVKSKPQNKGYRAVWSEWSPSTCWKNEGGEEEDDEDNKLFILITLGPVCLAVGVMLFVLNKPAIRKKIRSLSHTPTPAPFFQPLFQQHGGDLKEWLQPKGGFALTYKTEEILAGFDAVTVEPKPATKDPEELRVFSDPTAHLALAQCHTSYVGLPGVHEATAPLVAVCPGGAPYTRLHCSLWGVLAAAAEEEEAEVVSAPPEDFLDVSSEDSGCSCADPTQSPESSFPNSPVADCPPPRVCVDYCILNKTAGGFVPVLLSQGGGSLNVST
ncbi:interleukin-21 receptor-like [Pungitius pungitius]|uniref:interleukin-21 receptor-like n=1 Tax=Pungitius pungitius TaxID=134920 RepID=UPI002E0FE99A